jgi:hypothetical protein
MGERFSSNNIAIVRRDRWALGFALLLVLGALLCVAIGALPIFALLVAGVVATHLVVNDTWTRDEQARVKADAEGVHVNGELVASRAWIRDGVVVPDFPNGVQVRIRRWGALPLQIRARDTDEGRAILRALGLDVTQRAMTFNLPSRAATDWKWYGPMVLAWVLLVATVIMLPPEVGGHYMAMPLPALVLIFVVFRLTRSKLTVGADGLWLSGLGQRRFFRYDDIAAFNTLEPNSLWTRLWEGFLLRLHSGEEVRIAVEGRNHKRRGHAERLHVIDERVRGAMDSHRRGERTAGAARLLDRGERDIGEWIRTLRAMGSGGAADHRTAAVEPEMLWSIVEDPRATPLTRVSAAVALGASIDDTGRKRLETLAKAVAAPKLRIALEAAASEDEAEMREALEAVEEPKRRARA